MSRLIECVPNFSEGRDPAVIEAITSVLEAHEEVTLLDVDPGHATHRTVVTFVGEPEPVLDAAVALAIKAAEVIDMSAHAGEHPRFGAMDVCPLVPVAGITMEETVEHARTLAARLANEVGLTIYCYEEAALRPERKNLAVVRAGEYEGLPARLSTPEGEPDFGPADFNARSGATAVGARDFLIAYNVNLNTTSTRRANALAFDVREKGRMKRDGDGLTGEIVRDAQGQPEWIPGSLECVKGIGWFIEEYGIAQVSMNLTNTRVTPLHAAFDECVRKAAQRGLRVTGSEAVGLIPLQAMLDAGRHYLRQQERSTGVPDAELIKIAVRTMGLDELAPFDPETKIIEYAIRAAGSTPLADSTLRSFTEQTASESPAPGGGSVAAALGSMGAALGTMVANLSSHKRGWDDRWDEFSEWAEKGKAAYVELLSLVDKDTEAFNGIMEAWKAAPAERDAAIQSATAVAIEVPLRVMQVCLQAMDVCRAMATTGMEASLSDAGVGALCVRSAAIGAFLNVRINLQDLSDREQAAQYLARAESLRAELTASETEVLALVESKLA